jgi:aminoglycoside phosphotransferase (APT) family kinase protein
MAQDEVLEFAEGDHPGLDTARVGAWLTEHTPVAAPVEFGLIAAGGSNLTYRITDASGEKWVLRRPPVGELLQSAHDVAREARILQGLWSTSVPVPEIVGLCTDHDVTGASFFVMRYVEGLILRTEAMGVELGPDGARTASLNFFEALAAIHTASTEAAGLDGLSRPDGYVERQLRRWHQQYLQTAGDEASPVEAAVHERLAAAIPPDVAPGTSHLVHGDFHIDNAVFDADLSVKAIFDWELSTLGNPIADLAWAMLFWAEPGDTNAFLQDPPSLAAGFPSRAEAIAAYQRASGYDVEAMPYFEAFSKWKMACLLSGTLHRARRGTGGGMQVKTGSNLESQLQRILALFDEASGLI